VNAPAFQLSQADHAAEPPEARGLARDEVRMLVAERESGALEHATFRDLPAHLRATALGLPAGLAENDVDGAIARIAADPWLDAAAAAADAPRRLRAVGQVGAFRGFGGPFLRPPQVWASSRQLVVTDGETVWRIIADRYGTSFVRHAATVPADPPDPAISLTAGGKLTWGDDRLDVPAIAGAVGFASDGLTLAVTLPMSHRVFLFARSPAAGAEGGRA